MNDYDHDNQEHLSSVVFVAVIRVQNLEPIVTILGVGHGVCFRVGLSLLFDTILVLFAIVPVVPGTIIDCGVSGIMTFVLVQWPEGFEKANVFG